MTIEDLTAGHTARVAMPATFTAADPDSGTPGEFRALVSAYDVKYRIGWMTWHTIRAGAFASTIDAGKPIPIYAEHNWQAGASPIGHATASDSADGLILDGELYVDDADVARRHRAMSVGAINEWSIGYQITAIEVDDDDDTHEYVTAAEVFETSSVLRGANPSTETLKVAARLLGRDVTEQELAGLLSGDTDDTGNNADVETNDGDLWTPTWDDYATVAYLKEQLG